MMELRGSMPNILTKTIATMKANGLSTMARESVMVEVCKLQGEVQSMRVTGRMTRPTEMAD